MFTFFTWIYYKIDYFLIWKLFAIFDDSEIMELEMQIENVSEGDIFIRVVRESHL